jgi:hypothetical protein
LENWFFKRLKRTKKRSIKDALLQAIRKMYIKGTKNCRQHRPSFVPDTMSAAAPMTTPPAQQQMDPMWQQDEQAAEWVRQVLAMAPPPSLEQQQEARAWATQQRISIIDLADTDGDGDDVRLQSCMCACLPTSLREMCAWHSGVQRK